MSKIGIYLALFGWLMFACEGDRQIEPVASTQNELLFDGAPTDLTDFPEFTKDASIGDFRLPDHSRIVRSEDGSSVTFEFPEGLYFVEEDNDGNPVLQATITYTCNCSKSGGCVVIHVGQDFGCLHGNCNGTCSGSYGESDPSGGTSTESLSGGFVDLNQPVSFLTSAEEALALYPFHPLLMNLAETETGRTMLALNHVAVLNEGHDAEGPSKVIAVNFYGTLVGIDLPETYLASLPNAELFQTVTCNCGSGSSGCTLNQNESIALCVGAGCASCTMTVNDERNPHD